MTMTRQHFQLVADTIKNLALDGDEALRADIAKEFANELAATNSNFNKSRFLDACVKDN